MTTINYAMHTAYLAPMTGDGLLVLPLVKHDLGAEFYASAWEADLRALSLVGYEPDHEGDYEPVMVGELADGREVIALRGEGVIVSPSIEHMAAAWSALLVAAGLPAAS